MSKTKYIGLDIGGTKILLQTFDSKFRVIQEVLTKTQARTQKTFLRQVFDLLNQHYKKGVKGIGVAVPGIVNTSGVLVKAPHIPSKNIPLKKLIETKYKTKVHIENDLNAFLVAEYQKPSLSKYQNVVAIMVGTGVGGAAIVNGKLIKGKDGFAGEIGHMIIAKGTKKDTLEKLTSGAYNKNFKKALEDFGIGLSNLNLIFNPDVIVLGGSVYKHHFSKQKKRLETIIAKHSLAKKSPKLINARSSKSIPLGVVMLTK